MSRRMRKKRIEEIYIFQQDIQKYVSIMIQRKSLSIITFIITFLFLKRKENSSCLALSQSKRQELIISFPSNRIQFLQAFSSLIKYQSENANTRNVSKQTINWIIQKINIQLKLETKRKRQNERATQLRITINFNLLSMNFELVREMFVNKKKERKHSSKDAHKLKFSTVILILKRERERESMCEGLIDRQRSWGVQIENTLQNIQLDERLLEETNKSINRPIDQSVSQSVRQTGRQSVSQPIILIQSNNPPKFGNSF
ncbi:hypothetical protein ABPG72_017324 [Tetrahymena utriculariae]